MQRVTFDQAHLYFDIVGTGKPIMLIHGLGLDHTIWKPLTKKFSNQRQFILPDVRGHGRSTLGTADGTLDQMAGDLVRTLDWLQIDKVILAGHSMGGYITLAFAAKFPDRLAGLALITSNARADSQEKREARVKDARRVLDEGVTFIAASMAPKLTYNKKIASRMHKIIEKNDAEGLSNVLKAIANRKSQLQMLKNLTVPGIAVFGQEDQIAQPGVDTEIYQANPKLKVIHLPGVGHMPMLEQPLTLGALLLTL